jgi:hypothetical protein
MFEHSVHCIAGRDAHPFREVDQDLGDRALAVHASLLSGGNAARASNALPSEGIVRPEGTPGARRHPEITLIVFAA